LHGGKAKTLVFVAGLGKNERSLLIQTLKEQMNDIPSILIDLDSSNMN